MNITRSERNKYLKGGKGGSEPAHTEKQIFQRSMVRPNLILISIPQALHSPDISHYQISAFTDLSFSPSPTSLM